MQPLKSLKLVQEDFWQFGFEADYDQREAFVADIPSTIYHLWTPGEKKIAQLELLSFLGS